MISALVSPWSSQQPHPHLFLIITGKDTEFLFSLRFRNCPVLKFALKLIADSNKGREVAIVIVYLKN